MDPLDDTVCRWWNGATWTDDVRPLESFERAAADDVESARDREPAEARPPARRPARSRRRMALIVGAASILAAAAATVTVLATGGGDDARVERLTSVGLVTCAHLEGGDRRCWGGDERVPNGRAKRDVAGLPPVEGVVAGEDFSCGIDREEVVWCWGSNRLGQLGNASLIDDNPTAQLVPEVEGAVEVAVARGHACARLRNGTARCWGRANRGQVGTGAVADVAAPAPISELEGIEQLAIGDWSGCGVDRGGRLWCWGDDTFGQTSSSSRSSAPRPTPVRVELGARVRDVAVGSFHTCVLIGDRDVRCWGAGADGQLGPGHEFGSVKPVRIDL